MLSLRLIIIRNGIVLLILFSMKFPDFREWIKNNPSLFTNYFAAFHSEIWSERNRKPTFLSHIDCECLVQT